MKRIASRSRPIRSFESRSTRCGPRNENPRDDLGHLPRSSAISASTKLTWARRWSREAGAWTYVGGSGTAVICSARFVTFKPPVVIDVADANRNLRVWRSAIAIGQHRGRARLCLRNAGLTGRRSSSEARAGRSNALLVLASSALHDLRWLTSEIDCLRIVDPRWMAPGPGRPDMPGSGTDSQSGHDVRIRHRPSGERNRSA